MQRLTYAFTIAAMLAHGCGDATNDSGAKGVDVVTPSGSNNGSMSSNQNGGGASNSGTAQRSYTVFPGPCVERNRYYEDFEEGEESWLYQIWYTYDSQDRLVEEFKTLEGRDRDRRYYFYDEEIPDRLIQMQWKNLFEEDESGIVQYFYDDQGRLELKGEDVTGDSVADFVTQYVYGDRIVEIYFDNNGDQEPDRYTIQRLDDDGKMTSEQIFDLDSSADEPQWRIEYVYDGDLLEEEWRHFRYLATPIHLLYTYDSYGNRIYKARTQDETDGVEHYMTEYDYSCWPQ